MLPVIRYAANIVLSRNKAHKLPGKIIRELELLQA